MSERQPTIEMSVEKLGRFKQAYDNCESKSFEFDGHRFLTSYAKYLIEYLKGVFK